VSQARKRFAVASGLPPTAEEVTALTTSGRQDVSAQRGGPHPAKVRTAFTWRLTADQALALEEMTLRLKRQLNRPKLDKAEMLAALVALADENRAVFGALVARMESAETP